MNTFALITIASLAGGVLSALLASLIGLSARKEWIPSLVSFAVGALLGAAFLEMLPHAIEGGGDVRQVALVVLIGILGFFVLEKLVIWRHSHGEEDEAGHGHAHGYDHGHDHGRSGLMIVVGDAFHNFVDGVLIAGAFMQSDALGLVAATAVIVHQIPQAVGDYLVLVHSGYARARALGMNLLSALAMLAGAWAAWFGLRGEPALLSSFIALAAASMIYVAVADLIPGLHRRPELSATLRQVVLIGLGIALIALMGRITHSH